jgi:SAM-dependent methyltransferase
MEWSVRRINRLLSLTRDQRYLEIGVSEGKTFHSIKAREKVAVDPQFLFTFRHQTNNSYYFEEKSDEFFGGEFASKNLFDVIFLDGLHEYSQTYRDFLNALKCLAPGGFILIDDVYPIDEFSFNPNPKEAIRDRELSIAPKKLQDFSWNGDVFKTIALIHDFHSEIEYMTFWDHPSQAQTVLWCTSNRDARPHYPNITAVSNLIYETLTKDLHLLKQMQEKEIFEILEQL